MTPNSNRQAVVVGLFVTVALAILAGGILTIGDLNDTFTRKVTVTSVFDEVNGLQRGDNVWFSGLKVGTVSALAFYGDRQVEVTLQVDAAAVPYIHDDARAKVSSDGLIGNRIVVLYGGTSERPTLSDGAVLEVGEAVSTEAIMTMLQTNNTNLLAITTDIKGITAKVTAGEGTLGRLVQDDALYADVAEVVGDLKAASGSAKALTGSLATFADTFTQEGALPHELATDRTTYAELQATVRQLRQTGDAAAAVVDGLATTAADPATPLGVLLHDAEVGAGLKVTLGNLGDSSALLKEDLEAIQHNFLLRGFFKRRARLEAREAAR